MFLHAEQQFVGRLHRRDILGLTPDLGVLIEPHLQCQSVLQVFSGPVAIFYAGENPVEHLTQGRHALVMLSDMLGGRADREVKIGLPGVNAFIKQQADLADTLERLAATVQAVEAHQR